MTRRILAIDPGAHCGVALLEDARLVRVLALHADVDPAPCPVCPLCPMDPCDHAAKRPARLVGGLLGAGLELRSLDSAVIESPEWWRSSTPNAPALLDLAKTAGALAGALLAQGVDPVLCLSPRSWKGTTRKPDHQIGTLASLDESERALVPRGPLTGRYQSDALDAVGLGLWACGRWGQWTCDPSTFAHEVDPAPVRGRRAPRRQQPAQGGLALFAEVSR